MTVHSYIVGWIGVGVVVTAVGFGAIHLRALLLPGWNGAPARLAEAVLALSTLILIEEALGIVGLLEPIPVVVASIAAGVGLGVFARGRAPEGAEPLRAPRAGPVGMAIALGVAGLVVAKWSLHTQVNLDRGMYGFDTMWYHMPFAATFVQEGSVTGLKFTDPLYLNWFYPNNSELLHALGAMIFHRDILSPLINVGWVALTLLAAWCVGRPYGVGPASVVGAAIVLNSHTLVSRQPGDAKNDIVCMCLLLSSVALILNSQRGLFDRERRGPLIVAGLAAGLALGTKLTLLAPIVFLTAAIFYLAPKGARWAMGGTWTAAVAATGGFWYLRNLLHAGSPLPWIKHLGVGPLTLPHPLRVEEGRPPFSVSHYLFNGRIYDHYFFPGLHQAFGRIWPAVLALAVLGMVLMIVRGASRIQRMLGAVALAASVAYLFTPLTASGPEGQPDGFVLNLRYLAPALVVGLALLPAVPDLARQGWRRYTVALGLLAVLLLTDHPKEITHSKYEKGAYIAVLAIVLIPVAVASLRRLRVPKLAVALASLALLGIGAGLIWPEERDYVQRRYTRVYAKFNIDTAIRWANHEHDQRIGIGGSTIGFFQYGLYGLDLSNHVQYVGDHGPHAAFNAIQSCANWRRQVNAGHYNYLVTSQKLNQNEPSNPLFSPEGKWTRNDPAAKMISKDGPVEVYRVHGPLDPGTCNQLVPARVKVAEHRRRRAERRRRVALRKNG